MVHQKHDGARAGGHQQHGIDKADVVAGQNGRSGEGDVLVARDLEAVHAARQHPRHKAQQVLGHPHENVERHHRVGNTGEQKDLRNRAAAGQQRPGDQRAGDHEQRVQDVVGRDGAGAVRGRAAQLDQRIHGHAVQAGKQAQQRQIGHDTPVGGLGGKGRQTHHRAGWQATRGKVQIHRKHAHANRPQRHQADLYMAAAQYLAQQRTGADTDGEHHQQQRGHLRVAVQHLFGKAGELAQEHRAKKPHPANTQQRAEHHRVAVGQL